MRFQIASALVIGSITILGAQEDPRQTLPELARRVAPNPVYQSRTRDFILEPVDNILPRTDLIVYGTVERATSYLSSDKRDLYTDYVVRLLRVIPQSVRSARTTPGQTTAAPRSVVVTRWGGQLDINGVQVTQEDANLQAFRPGEELVLLLTRDQTEGKYHLASPVSGTFVVHSSVLTPLAKNIAEHHVFDRVRGLTVAQLATEIGRLSR
jgi:hypothetical protein